jgi:hypothetical protein
MLWKSYLQLPSCHTSSYGNLHWSLLHDELMTHRTQNIERPRGYIHSDAWQTHCITWTYSFTGINLKVCTESNKLTPLCLYTLPQTSWSIKSNILHEYWLYNFSLGTILYHWHHQFWVSFLNLIAVLWVIQCPRYFVHEEWEQGRDHNH